MEWAKLLAENRAELTPERAQELQAMLGNQALEHLLEQREQAGAEESEAESEEEKSTADLEAEAEESVQAAPPPRMLPRMGGDQKGGGAVGVEVLKGGDEPDEPSERNEPPESRYTPSAAALANATLHAALTERGLLSASELTSRQRQLAERAAAITPDPLGAFLAPIRQVLQRPQDVVSPDLADAMREARTAGIWCEKFGWSETARAAGALLAGPIGALLNPDSAAESLLRIGALLDLALYDPQDSRTTLAVVAVSDSARRLAVRTMTTLGPPVPTARTLYRRAVGAPQEVVAAQSRIEDDGRLYALWLSARPGDAPTLAAEREASTEPGGRPNPEDNTVAAADAALHAILGNPEPTRSEAPAGQDPTITNTKLVLGFAANAQVELCTAALAVHRPQDHAVIDATLLELGEQFRRVGQRLVQSLQDATPSKAYGSQQAKQRFLALRDEGLARLAGVLPQPLAQADRSNSLGRWDEICSNLTKGRLGAVLDTLLQLNASGETDPLQALLMSCLPSEVDDATSPTGTELAAKGRELGLWHLGSVGACIRANRALRAGDRLNALESLLQFAEILARHNQKSALDMIVRRVEEFRAEWGEGDFNALFKQALSTVRRPDA